MTAEVENPVSAATGATKIHALTSLRFFAALYVVLFHTFRLPAGSHFSWLLPVTGLGFISVSFFFFLSGYILAVVYLAKGKAVQSRRFFSSRFARIYPLFLVSVLADLPPFLRQDTASRGLGPALQHALPSLAGHVLMLQAWKARFQFGPNFPTWSLSVETFFYLCFPLLGVALWRLRGRSLLTTAACLYVAGQVVVYGAAKFCAVNTLKYNPLLHLSTFALGICLYRWQHERDHDRGSSVPSTNVLISALAGSLAAMVAVIAIGNRLPYANLHDGLLVPIFASAIWCLSYPHFRVARWLGARWLVLLGESSFALYSIHIVVLHWYRPDGADLSMQEFAVYLAVCVTLSVLSFQFFESPARSALLRISRVRSQESMQAASDA